MRLEHELAEAARERWLEQQKAEQEKEAKKKQEKKKKVKDCFQYIIIVEPYPFHFNNIKHNFLKNAL